PSNFFPSLGERADAVDAARASAHDALAWVFFNEGKLMRADTELARALDFTKKNAEIYYHLGRLRVAQGREADAELAYAEGMTVRARGTNPNRKELESVYRARHGNLEGW